LDKGKLLYYAKPIKRGKSPQLSLNAGRKQVLGLINDLKPNVLAIEKTFVTSNSLMYFLMRLKQLAKGNVLKC